MPNSYGAGISYVKENRLTLAADFLYEDWANAYFDNEKGQFKNRTRVAAGAEFIPVMIIVIIWDVSEPCRFSL